jgi:hypothetical protein
MNSNNRAVPIKDLNLPEKVITTGPDTIDIWLSTHVRRERIGRRTLPVAYNLLLGRPSHAEPMWVPDKISSAIGVWDQFFWGLMDREKWRPSRPAARGTFDDLNAGAIARTWRILTALDVLLTDAQDSFPALCKPIGGWKSEDGSNNGDGLEPLRAALDWRHKDSLLLSCFPAIQVNEWQVSFPLLLVRAAALSQTGRSQPFLWEAYSALAARTEHHRHQLELPDIEVDVLAYLVRFQSAPGQYARGSGDGRFLNEATALAKDYYPRHPRRANNFRRALLTALGILGHAQEFRSRKIPLGVGASAPLAPSDNPPPTPSPLPSNDEPPHPGRPDASPPAPQSPNTPYRAASRQSERGNQAFEGDEEGAEDAEDEEAMQSTGGVSWQP